jgi:hypothetical protein
MEITVRFRMELAAKAKARGLGFEEFASEGGRYGRRRLEAGGVLGDYVEGLLKGQARAAKGAFFEEAAD